MAFKTKLYNSEKIKNFLMNGGLEYFERNIQGSVTDSGDHFVADRFNWYTDLGLSVDVEPVAPPNDIFGRPIGTNAIRIERNLGALSVTPTTLNYFNQGIEGKIGREMIGKKVIFSFYTRCNKALTSCFRLRNPNANKTYLKDFTIDSANTWERKEIPVEILGTDSWNRNNTALGYFGVALDTGSNFQGVEGWQSGDVYGTATQDAVFDANNTYIEFAGLMVYIADEPQNPEFKTYKENSDEELLACQRHCEVAPVGSMVFVVDSSNGQIGTFDYQFKAKKRVVPSVGLINVGHLNSPAGDNITITSISEYGVSRGTSPSAFNVGYKFLNSQPVIFDSEM